MKPVDMKVSAKALYGPSSPVGDKRTEKVYPYGLELRLDGVILDKLNLKEMPDTDDEVTITGVAVVTETRKSANGGDKSRSITLQITKLAISCEDDDEAMERGFKKGNKRK